jgi:hypothetical protein
MYVLLYIHPSLLSGLPFVCISRTGMIQRIEIYFQGLLIFVRLYCNRTHLSHSVLHFIFGLPPNFCLSLLSAASAVMGHDLWLVITSCCVHTHTHTYQLAYLLTYLLPSLLSPLCRFIVYSGTGFCWLPYLHRHPTLLLCLLRNNITWTQLMRLRSGPVTHPLLLSSSGILLKWNPLLKPTSTGLGYSWLRCGIIFNCIPWWWLGLWCRGDVGSTLKKAAH